MYTDYFKFNEPPFSITPNPKFLYLGQRHQEAIAHLLYGIQEGNGFVLLTGEVGTGKTTVSRYLLRQLPESADVALILNPKLSAYELVATICDEFGVEYDAASESMKGLIDALNRFLLENHQNNRQSIVIIDEAQNLDADVLEQIRLLTNLETHQRKLLQIILLGQPELRELLNHPRLRQLSQRITARYHLNSLTSAEVGAYIQHRLAVSGVTYPLFSKGAVKKIYDYSKGVPRLINTLSDRALLGAFAQHQRYVSPKIVHQAAREILPPMPIPRYQHPTNIWGAMVIIGVLIFGAGAYWYWNELSHPANVELLGQREVMSQLATSEGVSSEALQVSEDDELSTWLIGHQHELSLAQAFSWLFNYWQVPPLEPKGLLPCDYAQQFQLRCAHKQGNRLRLQQSGYPALLRLVDSAGLSRYVVASGMLQDQIVLESPYSRIEVSSEALDQHWMGEYTLLWRPPVGYEAPLTLGDQGVTVSWLHHQLNAEALRLGLSDPNIFDERLQTAVMFFQEQRGLLPTGIAGEDMMMQLSQQSSAMR